MIDLYSEVALGGESPRVFEEFDDRFWPKAVTFDVVGATASTTGYALLRPSMLPSSNPRARVLPSW